MIFTTKCYLLLIATASAYSNVFNYKKRVDELFKAHGVAPNVIPKSPEGLAFVIHPSGVEAVLGGEVTPSNVKDAPAVAWDASPDHYYTMIVIDPDESAPTNRSQNALLHWLVSNIQGNSQQIGVKGEVIAEFIGPAPSPDTGLHRYVFLVYQQPKKLEFDDPRIDNTSAAGRSGFILTKFVNKYNLGHPIAGNFYRARYDDSVPLLRAQVGDESLLYCLTGPSQCK